VIRAGLVGVGVIFTVFTLVWMLSVRRRDAGIADVFWGLGFVLLAWLYCFLSPVLTPRSWLVAALMTLWGTRLSQHIFRRNRGKGEDPRYQAMRAAQGRALLVAVSATRPAALTTVDGLGLLLFAVGFGFEVVGDSQLARFRAESDKRGKVLESGLWRYTRHPNTSETPRCGWACMPWRHQRRADGSPC